MGQTITIKPYIPETAELVGEFWKQPRRKVTITLDEGPLMQEVIEAHLERAREDEDTALRQRYAFAITTSTDGVYSLAPLWVVAHAYLQDAIDIEDCLVVTNSVRSSGYPGYRNVWTHGPNASFEPGPAEADGFAAMHVPVEGTVLPYNMHLESWLTLAQFAEERQVALLMHEEQCRDLARKIASTQAEYPPTFYGSTDGTFTATIGGTGDPRTFSLLVQNEFRKHGNYKPIACRFER